MDTSISINAVVEGSLDEAVVRRLTQYAGIDLGLILGKKGKSYILEKIAGLNSAAGKFLPWFVLLDLDNDEDCAPPAARKWLPSPSQYLCFRIAVREVETWLLADREKFSDYLGVDRSSIPDNPEIIPDPKGFVVNLAKSSKRRDVRDLIVPTIESGRKEGRAYTSILSEFVQGVKQAGAWRPDIASNHSDSLRRCIKSLEDMRERLKK